MERQRRRQAVPSTARRARIQDRNDGEPGRLEVLHPDVIKSVDRVNAWNKLPESERRKVAEI